MNITFFGSATSDNMRSAVNLEGGVVHHSSWVIAIGVNYFNMSLDLVKKLCKKQSLFFSNGNIGLTVLCSGLNKNSRNN
jgi:hypothetical protein